MDVLIKKSKTRGKVVIPSSKSVFHRALICASLAKGKSIIRNISYNDDVLATIDCLKKMGAKIYEENGSLAVEGMKELPKNDLLLNARASASTLRFLIGICLGFKNKIIVEGKENLFIRKNEVVFSVFEEKGIKITKKTNSIEFFGKLSSGDYIVDGSVSSQLISGLLFFLPLLEESSRIIVKNDFISRGYVDLTIDVLDKFNVKILKEDDKTFFIKGAQKYQPLDYKLEGDYSQMAFFACLGALTGKIECFNINKISAQPDRKIIEILKSANVKIKEHEESYEFEKSTIILNEVDLTNNPDLAPILAVLLSYSKSESIIKGMNRLVSKESNRKLAIINNLRKCNVEVVEVNDDEILIKPSNLFQTCTFDSYDDHRIFMSFAVLAATLEKGAIIKGSDAINKSYPQFLSDLEKVGVKYEFIK